MILQKAIAYKISNLLIEHKLTRYKLCKKACISEQALKHILDERNKDIKLSTLYLIADAFGMSLAEFFDDKLFDADNIEIKLP